MNLRRIKHTLLRLTAEEKVIGIGSLMMLIGVFMPWYRVVMNFDKKSLTETGFSGDLGVMGFIVFLMSLMSLLILVGENMHFPLPKFGYKREQIIFFLLGESCFLSLIAMAIYTKRSLEFTEAGLSFGLYMVLLGSFFGSLSAFALMQKDKKKEVEEFFSHEQEEEYEIEEEAIEKVVPSPIYFDQEDEMGEVREDQDIQKTVGSVLDDYSESKEMAEEIKEKPASQIDQSRYFIREAGRGNLEKDEKNDGHIPLGFYEDK